MQRLLQLQAKDFLRNSSNDALGTVGYVYEGSKNQPPTHRWRSVIERYIRSEFAIHMILREGPYTTPRNMNTRQYRVLVYWPRIADGFFLNRDRSLDRWKRKVKLLYQRSGQMERAVLVGVREFLQMPKGTLPALPCSAFAFRERLLRSDEPHGVTSDSAQELGSSASVKARLGLKNGKLEFSPHGGMTQIIEDEKLPNNVVKSGSKVVNDLSDLDSPHQGRVLLNVDADSEPVRISVELDLRLIHVAHYEGSNFSLDSVDLIPCSLDLHTNAI